MAPLNMHMQLDSGTASLNVALCLHLHTHVMCASGEGSDEIARIAHVHLSLHCSHMGQVL